MDRSPDPEKIFAEIKALIKGDVLCDELSRTIYSSAACLFQVKPLGIVLPRDREDVVRVVKYARANNIPLIPRGGGTSRVGNELGEGIILDFSRYMNGLVEVNPEERWARVQPGITQGGLNALLKCHKLLFPVDPSTKEHCTFGGMIANNSSGPHAIKYGDTRDNVLSLEIVLSDGEILATEAIPEGRTSGGAGAISRGVADVLRRYEKTLAEEKPFTIKNSSGYDLWHIRKNGGIDLTPLLVGSEGTLGIITEAKVRLWPLPGNTLGGLIYFDSLDKVGTAVRKILELKPTMLEIIERRILDLARQQKAELRPYLPEGIEAMLFIEFEEKDEETLRAKFAETGQAMNAGNLALDMKVARNKKDMEMLGKVRQISGPILNKAKGPKRPVAFVEDAAVHPTRLPQYIRGLREIFGRHEVEAGIYGHAGDGNMHLMVFLDLRLGEDVRKMLAIAEETYDLVLSLKGTISGEHGDGRLRTHYTRRQYPGLYAAFEEIKQLFDPVNLFNPGIIVGGEVNPLAHHLKFKSRDEKSALSPILTREEVADASGVCSGCGKCRSYCPIAMTVLDEATLGRAKATLIRGYLNGTVDPKILDSPRFKEVLDACVNCKRCLTECPSGADIPWLAIMCRSYVVEKEGEPFGQKVLASTRRLCQTSSLFAPLANLANSVGPFRKGLEAFVGLDARRKLPQFPSRTLLKMVEGRPRLKSDRKVAFFLGCFTNFNEPEDDGLATIEILEKNGYEVILPLLRCCGIARLSTGAVDQVEDDIRYNLRKLSQFADQGIPIVFSESSCALAVKLEYPKIVNTEEAAKVAKSCTDIHEFLMKLHNNGELNLDFGRMEMKIGYHNPCHLRALGITREPVELLKLIPGVSVRAYSDQCCGISGTFGLKKKNYDLSMKIGERLFREIAASDAGQLVTGCGACAMQIFQGTQRKPVAPVSLLARAYRLKEQTKASACTHV
jgi:anaerobic glycerol-3-phosphate dehydrogenase C subunit